MRCERMTLKLGNIFYLVAKIQYSKTERRTFYDGFMRDTGNFLHVQV